MPKAYEASQVPRKCFQGFQLRVMKSNAGSYIGTLDEEGLPNCRASSYYGSHEQASNALNENSWIPRDSEETIFCHRGNPYGCKAKPHFDRTPTPKIGGSF